MDARLEKLIQRTTDPLTAKGQEIMSAMKSEYGSKHGEEVFYASKNAGTITGVDDVSKMTQMPDPIGEGKSVAPRNALVVGDYK